MMSISNLLDMATTLCARTGNTIRIRAAGKGERRTGAFHYCC
jgi:hypothetical protein